MTVVPNCTGYCVCMVACVLSDSFKECDLGPESTLRTAWMKGPADEVLNTVPGFYRLKAMYIIHHGLCAAPLNAS